MPSPLSAGSARISIAASQLEVARPSFAWAGSLTFLHPRISREAAEESPACECRESWSGNRVPLGTALGITPINGMLISNIRSFSSDYRLLRLLRDIQQHANAHQSHEQRRSAVGNERQRNAFRRHQPQHDADVDESLQHDHAGDSDRQEASKVILSAQRRARPAPEKNRKKDDDGKRPHQPQFFSGDGKNKIRMWFGKIKQLLLPFHQAQSGNAAGRNRNQRLNNMETKPLRVSVRIQKRQYAIFPVGDLKDQKIKRQERSREGISKIAQANAGDEQDASR